MGSFYNSYSQFLKKQFGYPIYKISLSAGATCPNRDGSKGAGGCIYCSSSGSGKEYKKDVAVQIEEYLEKRGNRKEGYIAYFQAFSNMYKTAEKIKQQIESILIHDEIVGVSIATRPDTIDDDILLYLNKLKGRCFVQIELGLESSNDSTLDLLNRKEKSETFLYAVKRCRVLVPDSHIVGHVILGLPKENKKDYENTLSFLGDSGANGVKFHHLYIQKKTKIYDMFMSGSAPLMSENDYIDNILHLLSILQKEIVIHRLKSSVDASDLVAPLWTMDKMFYEKLQQRAEETKIYQGMKYGNNHFNCW